MTDTLRIAVTLPVESVDFFFAELTKLGFDCERTEDMIHEFAVLAVMVSANDVLEFTQVTQRLMRYWLRQRNLH